MLNLVYYYSLSQYLGNEYFPFKKADFSAFLKSMLDLENLNDVTLPSDFVTNKTIYDELFSLVLGRYHEHAIIKINKCVGQEPSEDEINKAAKNWVYKLVSALNMSWDYYMTLLTNYNAAKAELMSDIKATSKNKVKFNDTPQNTNISGTYEGDNYITHFTSTEGENSSPLMSKIMRLKEIQDAYKDVMSDWVKYFERIFYEEHSV